MNTPSHSQGEQQALTKLGVWSGTDSLTSADAASFAKRVEAWGYGALWIPEAIGREVFSAASWLLANTSSPDRRQRHRQYLRPRSGLFAHRRRRG